MDLRRRAYEIAVEEGADGDAIVRTIDCENDTWDPGRQSELTYKPGNRWGFPAGTKEKSFGLAMIHLPDHPDISYKNATDPEFALRWMAKEFAAGRASQWSCY